MNDVYCFLYLEWTFPDYRRGRQHLVDHTNQPLCGCHRITDDDVARRKVLYSFQPFDALYNTMCRDCTRLKRAYLDKMKLERWNSAAAPMAVQATQGKMTMDEDYLRPEPLTPEAFAEEMRRWQHGDTEIGHSQADRLMCRLLVALGYEEGVKVYVDMERWYA